MKYILLPIAALLVFFYIMGSGGNQDNSNYKGVSINKEWNSQAVCQTARSVIKTKFRKSKSDTLYSSTCTVSKVSAPLLGNFSHYSPYAVTWPNGVAARVFITNKGLKVMGVSENGIPESWN